MGACSRKRVVANARLTRAVRASWRRASAYHFDGICLDLKPSETSVGVSAEGAGERGEAGNPAGAVAGWSGRSEATPSGSCHADPFS